MMESEGDQLVIAQMLQEGRRLQWVGDGRWRWVCRGVSVWL